MASAGFAPDPQWGSIPGPSWGTTIPQTLCAHPDFRAWLHHWPRDAISTNYVHVLYACTIGLLCSPVKPVAPGTPVNPWNPGDPGEPIGPCWPASPVKPGKPISPG